MVAAGITTLKTVVSSRFTNHLCGILFTPSNNPITPLSSTPFTPSIARIISTDKKTGKIISPTSLLKLPRIPSIYAPKRNTALRVLLLSVSALMYSTSADR